LHCESLKIKEQVLKISFAFARTLFMLLSIFFLTTYTVVMGGALTWETAWPGIVMGLMLGFALIGIDFLFRRYNLRSFNAALIGLFFGYLMGIALTRIFHAIVQMTQLDETLPVMDLIHIILFLAAIYIGVIMTLRASDQLYLSIPFIRFTSAGRKIRELVLDPSVLADPRLIDLAASGIFDNQLIVPRFVAKELHVQAEQADEIARAKARRAVDVLQKLEEIEGLGLRYNDTDFPEVDEIQSKLTRLARLMEANVLTADVSRIQVAPSEGVRIINIHTLSNALKPLAETGQYLLVKIQRYGKEPRQGVGYLEDGTMVVVNGGGDFIGEEIKARVLSVKHTTSGRMIFCNVANGE
jgi:uncharacterized protein YacL